MAGVAAPFPRSRRATLYAEALFLLLPRPARSTSKNHRRPPAAVLEGALTRDIRHPGACHLYIHTTELTAEPARAEGCAELSGGSIPGASHINHMPAHIWTQVGRWGDAVQASLQAWQSDQKAARGTGFMTYPAHDLQMLAFAASMDGQGAVAMQAGAGFTTLTGDPMSHVAGAGPLRPVRRSAKIGARPASDISAGVGTSPQGYAQLRRGSAPPRRNSSGCSDGSLLEGGLQDSSREDAAGIAGRNPGGRDPSRRRRSPRRDCGVRTGGRLQDR